MVSRNQSFLTLPEGFPGGVVVKSPPANAGDVRDMGSVPGSRRSRGVGNGNPLQYSYLENPMDRGACGLESIAPLRVGHVWSDLAWTRTFQKCLWRNLGWAIFDNICLPQKKTVIVSSKRFGLVWSYFLVWMMILLKSGPALSTVDAVIFWFLWVYSGSRKTQHFCGVLLTSALVKSEIPEVPSSVILRSSC